ncbi:MAG: hypothetical protein IOC52_05505 [Methylobacterium sp.]|nr:hypothetical protein [Methylobacterium sp.]
MAKERIDIEELLRWAYQRQKVDRVMRETSGRGNGAAAWVVASENFLKYGVRIDNPTPAGMFAPRAPADAEIIHDTVLRLDDLFIDDEGGVWSPDRLESAGASLLRDKAKRFWMEVSGVRAPLTPCHLPALLIIHAKNGTKPEWCDGWRPAGARDRVVTDRSDRDKWGRARKAGRDFTADDVAFYRAEYRCWHAGLVLLAAVLADGLQDFEPIPPASAPAPWAKAKKAA